MKDPRDRIFMFTDCCMWEKNKQEGMRSEHAIEVVDVETGQTRWITSGSKIQFVEGTITEELSQEKYNAQP